jgi:hypothetical protein
MINRDGFFKYKQQMQASHLLFFSLKDVDLQNFSDNVLKSLNICDYFHMTNHY